MHHPTTPSTITFWQDLPENSIATSKSPPLSQILKVKILTILVAFHVVVRFLSNLSYLSDIHAIEYMGFDLVDLFVNWLRVFTIGGHLGNLGSLNNHRG